MNRRAFLGLGAAGLAAPELAWADEPDIPLLSDDEVLAEVAAVEGVLDDASRWSLDDFLDGPSGDDLADGVGLDLGRGILRTLFIAESLSSLPKDNRTHPAVQALVQRHSSEMDFAVLGSMRWLDGQGRVGGSGRVRRALRDDPDLVMRFGENLDGFAQRRGVAKRGRKRINRLFRHVGWQVSRRPLHSVLDEQVERSESYLAAMASAGRGVGPSEDVAFQRKRFEAIEAVLKVEPGDIDPETGKPTAAATRRRLKRQLNLAGYFGLGVSACLVGAMVTSPSGASAVFLAAGLLPLTGVVVMLIVALVTLIAAQTRARKEARRAGG